MVLALGFRWRLTKLVEFRSIKFQRQTKQAIMSVTRLSMRQSILALNGRIETPETFVVQYSEKTSWTVAQCEQ